MLDWMSLTDLAAHYNVTEGVLYSQSDLNWHAFPFMVLTQGQCEHIVLTVCLNIDSDILCLAHIGENWKL